MADNINYGRKHLSQVLAGESNYDFENGVNFKFASVIVTGAGEVDYIGLPLVSDSSGKFEVYAAQDIGAVTDSTLPTKAPVCIAMGSALGKGLNKTDADLDAGDVTMTVLYRGDATIVIEGMEDGDGTAWDSTALTTDQQEFLDQLQLQDISSEAQATSVTPAYTS